ncbi:sensor histidine kinase [Marinomonas balearica]|uniref:histidine kinase n=1 Tax=Marinomonas balearica TaxID=491947 RepID=A0A4R6MBG2_9GAMM|nr:sensor histidine kinase [Marinomonas balearica]TDO98833.1 two-component system sensor histidine kinase TctE [Marinomonas balearica]
MWRKLLQPQRPLDDNLELQRAPSLRVRFILTGMLVIGVITGIAVKLVFDYSQKLADLSYDRLLKSAILQMDENVGMLRGDVTIEIPWSAFSTLAQANEDRIFYKVESSSKGFMTGYPDLNSAPEFPIELGQVQFFNREYAGEMTRFAWMKRYLTEPDASGTVTIALAQTRISREEMSAAITQRAVQVVLVIALVAIALIVFGSQLVLRPLHRIERNLEERLAGDLTPISMRTPKETHHLKVAINHFMERLKTNLEQLENYTADAAHQLRTPIASLKALAENARDIRSPSEQHDALNNIIHQCESLSETVNLLLNQAVVSHRLQTHQMGIVNLLEPISQSCRAQAVSALRKGVHLSFENELESALIIGDEFTLHQLMQNLIENAVRYSTLVQPDERLEVIIRVESLLGTYRVSVIDHGVGIADEDKEKVFERFYRGNTKNQSYQITGTGVGLAMVKDIADHHHANITVNDTVPNGTTVCIEFPAYLGNYEVG